MSLSATMQLFQGWNSGGQYATTDMLGSLWNYIVGRLCQQRPGLACVGAVVKLRAAQAVDAACLFSDRVLCVTGLLKLFQAMRRKENAMSLDGAVVTLPRGRERHDADDGWRVLCRGRLSLQQGGQFEQLLYVGSHH